MLADSIALTLDLTAFGPVQVMEAVSIQDEDRHARNTMLEPDRVVPVRVLDFVSADEDGTLRVELPPVAWTMLRLRSSS